MMTRSFTRAVHPAKLSRPLRPTAPCKKARCAVHWLCGVLLLAGPLLQLARPPRTVVAQNRVAAANVAATDDAQDARASAMKSIEYLADVMDQYHNRFIVYEDAGSPGNHFSVWPKMPNGDALVWSEGAYPNPDPAPDPNHNPGATVIRCRFQPGGVNWGGFYLLNGVLPPDAQAPLPNFGTYLNAGINLSGVTVLSFWARGERGGELVEFFMGGVGRHPDWGWVNWPCTPDFAAPCIGPDSTPVVKIKVTLTEQWKQYCIDLDGKNLSHVLGGFGWAINALSNPDGAVLYLDDIQYELSAARRQQRLNEPRLLRSFTTAPRQPDLRDGNKDDDFDLVLRNTAFVYDNALALLAFLADGTVDSVRRARLIGDALVYATRHDRKLDNGGLRSAYAAGDIASPPGWTPNGRAGTVPAPGFYEEAKAQFFETDDARIVDTGNNAWAMIALLALYQRTGHENYLTAAQRLGNVIRSFRQNSGTYQGFKRGLEEVDDPNPKRREGASAEHNIDIYAAFVTMSRLTGEAQWQAEAEHARAFVEAMWDSQIKCYWAGTENPEKIYKGD